MNLTASPQPVTLQGVEYTIKPLSDEADHNVTQWVRSELLAITYAARNKVAELGENPDEFVKSIVSEIRKVEWMDDEGASVLRTKFGMARVLLESIKPTHAGASQLGCVAMLADPTEAEIFWQTFLMVNDLSEIDDDSTDAIQKKSKDSSGEASGTVHEDTGEASKLDANDASGADTDSACGSGG